MSSHVALLNERLARRGEAGLLALPGCWDAFTLRLLEGSGCEAGFVSGAALSMAQLGQPDLGLVEGERVVRTVAAMRECSDLPLVVDGDTGFGNALTLQRFVKALEAAGASAVQIEDQTFPKRCGHMAGKRVVPLDEAVGRIRAALDARSAMLIVARTDALGAEGFDAACERAERFIEEGADIVFVEGPRTMAQLETVAERFAARVPLVHNLVAGGVTPTDEGMVLERLGFAAALHPLMLMGALARIAPKLLGELAREKSARTLTDKVADLGELNALFGLDDIMDRTSPYGC